MLKLAIVGDGLASAICLDRLVNYYGVQDIAIDVYSPSGEVGRGIAYHAKTPDEMLLNHRIKSMRFSDETGVNFLNYVRENYKQDSSLDEYVPRRVFGDFVTKNVAAIFNKNSGVKMLQQYVTKIDVGGSCIQVQTQQGRLEYDEVLVCIGGGSNADNLALNYIDAVGDVGGKNVAITGASLSGVDLVNLFFADSGKSPKKLTLLQRTAGFRSVRPTKDEKADAKILTGELVKNSNGFTSDKLIGLIRDEVKAHRVDYDIFTYGGLVHAQNFNLELACVLNRLSSDPYNKGNHPEFKIHAILNAIVPQIMDIFEQGKMSSSEVEKFRKSAEKAIFAYLAPIPPVVAKNLAELIGKGRLEVVNGVDADLNSKILEGFDLHYDARGMNGILRSFAQIPSSLRSMFKSANAGLSKAGGVAYEPNSSKIVGKPEGRMPYIVGQLKKGQQFDCSESAVIYNDCVKVVDDMMFKYNNEGKICQQGLDL